MYDAHIVWVYDMEVCPKKGSLRAMARHCLQILETTYGLSGDLLLDMNGGAPWMNEITPDGKVMSHVTCLGSPQPCMSMSTL